MSQVDPPPLPFGTVAAVFESPEAAARAADELASMGYPRHLMTVLTGRPWETTADEPTGITPDMNLRLALVPASAHDRASLTLREEASPALASFARTILEPARRPNPAALPVLALFVGLSVTLIVEFALRNWVWTTIVGLIALHLVVAALVLAYGREHVPTFPFRARISSVEDALEQGGALLTVRCTLPYRSVVEDQLHQMGGDVLGYAPKVAYPVPVA